MCLVDSEHRAERVCDLAQRGVGLRAIKDCGHGVRAGSAGCLGEAAEGGLDGVGVAFASDPVEAIELALRRVRGNRLELDAPLRVRLERVHADDDALAALHELEMAVRRILDLAALETCFDRRDGAAQLIDSAEVRVGGGLDRIGQALDVVGAGEGVDGVRDAGLVREDLLRAERERGGLLGWQSERLVLSS